MRRVAVVGSGIAGLAAARSLSRHQSVTLFEAGERFGGHAHTVDVRIDGMQHGVDCGFLVYNEPTYPNLTRLFAELGVATAPAEMSLSVQLRAAGIEWSGRDATSVFAQPGNLARPAFWRMLVDIVRFNRLTTALAEDDSGSLARLEQSIGDFLATHRFSASFRDWYFLPMIGCIWSCPPRQMLDFPAAMMIGFCHEHGLLRLHGRPEWRSVRGGAVHYVARMLEGIADTRLRLPVRSIRRRGDGGVDVGSDAGSERFDAVVLACHSDQALAMLADASTEERRLLGAITYGPNRAVLHTDVSLLPRRRRAWAAWNYERGDDAGAAPVCLHYLINRLQPLPFATPVIVTLNPQRQPAPESVQGEFDFAHPVLDRRAVAAQAALPTIQGRGGVFFCGAWTRYGFHEDGLVSGLAAASAVATLLDVRAATAPMALDSCTATAQTALST